MAPEYGPIAIFDLKVERMGITRNRILIMLNLGAVDIHPFFLRTELHFLDVYVRWNVIEKHVK